MSRWDEWLNEIRKAEGDVAGARSGEKIGYQPLGKPRVAPAMKPMASGHMDPGYKAPTPSLEKIRSQKVRSYSPPGGAVAQQHDPRSLEQIQSQKVTGAPGTTSSAERYHVSQQAQKPPEKQPSLEEIREQKVKGYQPKKPLVTPATRPAGGGPPGQPDSAKLAKPHAPGKEGEKEGGREEDKNPKPPLKISGVRKPSPRGPSPMDWFQYGQAQGQMTTHAGSAPSILAAHTARVLGRVQRATGARRYGPVEAAQQRQMMLTRMAPGGGGGGGSNVRRSLSPEGEQIIKSHTLPSIYLHSKLFPRGRLAQRDKAIKLPDPAEENLQPGQDELPEEIKSWAHKAIHRIIESAGGIEKARRLLMAMAKAGAAQESSGRHTFPSEDQAKREEESPRAHRGVGNAGTPDLPERGGDWHGTVPGVPDVPEDSEDVSTGKTGEQQGQDRPKPKKKQQPTPGNPANPPPPQPSKTEEAIKALAGAPRFSSGPFIPPREAKFLLEFGYSPEEIKQGDYRVAPWMRAEFNRQQTSVINKSIDGLLGRISR